MGRKVQRIYASPELAAVIRASQRQRRIEQMVSAIIALVVVLLVALLPGCATTTAPAQSTCGADSALVLYQSGAIPIGSRCVAMRQAR